MWRDAGLVAGKDLRIELRSRVVSTQVAPFAVLVLVLFAIALGPDPKPLLQAAPGLFWVSVLFASLVASQRSFAVESSEGARDGLRLWGLDPAGVFLGKVTALCTELLAIGLLLGAGIVLLYGARIHSYGELVVAAVAGIVGLASAGTLYGAMVSGLRVRETLLPLLLLPVVAPVALGGTRAWQGALASTQASSPGPWLQLLIIFAAVYLALGVVIFGPLQEAS
ncbi:MAG TPA: heme exporter protein CcmB [Acidimicrobiales bacterium]|nr:heme exporter protein CcmB [Acidimicrobiales bacterium]